MDWISWLGVFGFLISGFILLYGIRRARAHAVAIQESLDSSATKQETPQSSAASFEGGNSYIDALKTGDPEKIATARLPDLLTPETLFQGLRELQDQTDALDVFIDRIRQQFALYQYRKLTNSWIQYIEQMGISQDVFWRQVTDRFLVPLQQQGGASVLKADIAEQEFRGAQAHHAQDELGRPKPKPEKPKTRAERQAEITKQYKEEDKVYEDAELPPDSFQRRKLKSEYEDRTRRLFEA